MVAEMARVSRPGGWVGITDEVEHPYEWMREAHADAWLGFTQDQVARLFADAAGPLRVRATGHAMKHPVNDLGRGRRHRRFHRLGPGLAPLSGRQAAVGSTVQPATLVAQHEHSVWMNARSEGVGSRPSGRSR